MCKSFVDLHLQFTQANHGQDKPNQPNYHGISATPV
jgi:hypothetical protein